MMSELNKEVEKKRRGVDAMSQVGHWQDWLARGDAKSTQGKGSGLWAEDRRRPMIFGADIFRGLFLVFFS
jgi:hypothetical protein